MIYADTDFFLALIKESDWLKKPAEALLKKHTGEIWTSPITLIELLLLAKVKDLDPIDVLIDALAIAQLRGGESQLYLLSTHYIKKENVGAFDSLHAASWGRDCKILSSDKVIDRLGLNRIPLGKQAA